jgi:hypothetical protein
MTTKSQRLKTRMAKDADRQALRRETMRSEGRPETHAVERALAEAIAYVSVQHHVEGSERHEVMIPLREVLATASEILAQRHDHVLSIEAVAARTQPRKPHLWTLAEPKRPKRNDI